MSRDSDYDREEDEWYNQVLDSNPWELRETLPIFEHHLILSSPLVPCIPQLSSLEYNVVDKFYSNTTTTVLKVSTKINGIEKLAVLKFVSRIF